MPAEPAPTASRLASASAARSSSSSRWRSSCSSACARSSSTCRGTGRTACACSAPPTRPPSPAWSTCPATSAQAVSTARAEAVKNGYTNGVDGVTVTPSRTPPTRAACGSPSAGRSTRSSRASSASTRSPRRASSKAEYVLPVPMGSPENYYGVFGLLRHPGGGVTTVTTNTFNDVTTSWFNACQHARARTPGPPRRTSTRATTPGRPRSPRTSTSSGATSGSRSRARSRTSTASRSRPRCRRSGTGNQTNCQIQFELSWDNGGDLHDRVRDGRQAQHGPPAPRPARPTSRSAPATDTWNRASLDDLAS